MKTKRIGRDFCICWTKPRKISLKVERYGNGWLLNLYWISIYSQPVVHYIREDKDGINDND